MNKTHIACYALITSAFILAALVFALAQDRFGQSAQASLVVNRENVTAMTARTRSNEESLFVLENNSQRLLVYNVDITKKRMELVGGLDLTKVFRTAAPTRSSTGGTNRSSR